jgi:hypothetical protein
VENIAARDFADSLIRQPTRRNTSTSTKRGLCATNDRAHHRGLLCHCRPIDPINSDHIGIRSTALPPCSERI